MPLPPILFRSPDFLVIDKPAGLPVHAGPRGGASVEDWFPLLSRRRDGPWLAHRLDADTAGCLVIALRRAALHAAQAAFAAGLARKTYWAIVRGTPSSPSGKIDARLAKVSTEAGWRMVVDPNGQVASTAWRLRGQHDGCSWLELRPMTGRTHQIRVHCAELGCPLVGDPVYGEPISSAWDGPLQLLARSIALDLPAPVEATAAPPEHMRKLLERFSPAGTTA